MTRENLILSMVSCSFALIEASKADSWSILISKKPVEFLPKLPKHENSPQNNLCTVKSPYFPISHCAPLRMSCFMRPWVSACVSDIPFLAKFPRHIVGQTNKHQQQPARLCRSCSFSLLAGFPITSQRREVELQYNTGFSYTLAYLFFRKISSRAVVKD